MKGENTHGRKTEKMDHSPSGICPDVCPQLFPDPTGDQVSGGRVVDTTYLVNSDSNRDHSLPPVETPKHLVKNQDKPVIFVRSRGRPRNSDAVKVVPRFRDPIDIAKFGRALIKLTQTLAEQKDTGHKTADAQQQGDSNE